MAVAAESPRLSVTISDGRRPDRPPLGRGTRSDSAGGRHLHCRNRALTCTVPRLLRGPGSAHVTTAAGPVQGHVTLLDDRRAAGAQSAHPERAARRPLRHEHGSALFLSTLAHGNCKSSARTFCAWRRPLFTLRGDAGRRACLASRQAAVWGRWWQ